ncbi:MAG: type 12 methyltransferase [Parcubacteria group bacterium Athens0714_24]|nr:MAG: type 12 methyltransferase [Parcubacteria group bacterium Athens0714_24]
MEKQETIQENQYSFPYHYIPTLTDGFSQTKNLFWGYEYLSYLNFVLSKLKLLSFDSLLDIGCGDGRFLHEAKKGFPNAILLGIDSSQRAISLAKAINPEINFICGDIQKINLDKKYDIITAVEVLEHIPSQDIRSFLESLGRLLNVNGKLIITVPSDNINLISKHYQHFNIPKIENLFNGLFKIEEIHYLNKNCLKNKIIQKLLGNRFFILNHKKTLNCLYNYYTKNLLIANKNNAKRIALIASCI